MGFAKKLKGCSKCAERRAKLRKIWENHIARKRVEKAAKQTRQADGNASGSGAGDHRVDGDLAVHAAAVGHRWGRNGKRF